VHIDHLHRKMPFSQQALYVCLKRFYQILTFIGNGYATVLSMNIKVKQAECAILDATIESSARPKKTLVVPEKDRQETMHSSSYTLRKSVDPDAEWLIKGEKSYFGYKGFVLADANKRFISKVHVTSKSRGKS